MEDPVSSTFKKIFFYFLPVLLAILTFFISFEMNEFPWLWWGFIILLLLGSYLLDKSKIWGVIPGVLLGVYVILDDFRPPRVGPTILWIGVVLIIYYVIAGIVVSVYNIKNKKKATD